MKKTFLKNKKNIQFLIIGLGLIGGSVAKRLSKEGFEVLAIDKNDSNLKYARRIKAINGSSEKIDFSLLKIGEITVLISFWSFSISKWILDGFAHFHAGSGSTTW